MKFSLTIFLILFGFFSAFGQFSTDVKSRLHNNLVTENNNRFVYEEFTLLSSKTLQSVQVRIYAEAETNFISRDQFLANVVSISQVIMTGIYSERELGDYDIKGVEKAIGIIDIDINFLMTPDGVRVKVKNGETENQDTFTWNDLI